MLASGDALGRVLIWDVSTREPMAVLGDAGAVFGTGVKEKAKVVGISWVTTSHILAILLDHGRIILWDCKSTCSNMKYHAERGTCPTHRMALKSLDILQMGMFCGRKILMKSTMIFKRILVMCVVSF